ncbi:tRNA (1-methyladenosine) methyltransferase [Thermococcus onnurineus NA1]|uniref:tRNA (1-methyladenosine) methyltransferase n=1 Tax=Thermococcus onnurineus (strain NA1) TaxID=523850 RepID=B6YXL6_THEON|nr:MULTISPECIES: tRNA (adenine-N1)-methyltransferase [Thermococcus]ACJ16829.1 tRNA (1-methyladenosine) methyltransferase [Thermococcus onnurineus NA1]NJE46825.1 tRNA (adenine-N1)-methyltransferase [Thermococcus sp. GR7]NJE78322.1 tRNA (adenine-N1)-methyltransferase [Thermococcus sp. GR4]NJF23381.1 tRNA (adenine-N1)-methyltransferase [Thermococcus sp. GR5]
MIREGDKVLLIDRRGKRYLVTVSNREFHTDLGIINLGELLNKSYGDTLTSHKGEEFKILKPDINDIIAKMKRGPQIVHPKDAGIIIAYAGISPGDTVIEAGVGSGALTIFLANIVGPAGKVISYEVREDFARIAQKNVELAGFSDRVTIKLKNIYEGIDEDYADHIVLDLPQPENVLPHAVEVLRPGGYFVAYTPCMNQVHRFFQALQEYRDHFYKPRVVEVLVREHEVKKECMRPKTTMLAHTGYITFLRKL